MKRNLVLTLAYDGTDFFGWQKTKLGHSIEGVLEKSIQQILGEPVCLQAASRTDRGVHAEEQIVNFFTCRPVSEEKLKNSLNALMPKSIRVLVVREVPIDFHPTLYALQKEYHYQVCLGSFQMPSLRHFSWHVPYPLDLAKMEMASLHLLGEHDFSSFCNFRKNLNYQNKIRTISHLSISQPQKGHLLFTVIGNHFLYKMVRNIVGTLIFVGRGKVLPDAIPDILSGKSRPLAGVTAPACGLTLKRIYYPQECTYEL